MLKKMQLLALSSLLVGSSVFADGLRYINCEAIVSELYKEKSGFRISEDEKKCIKEAGGDPTYGEITWASCAFLLDMLDLTQDDKFVDMGCGIGKFVAQAGLTTEVGESLGIELSETRCQCAQHMSKPLTGLYDVCVKAENEIRKKLQQPALKKAKKKTIKFIQSDMLKVDVSDATVIFICATCFSEDLMQKLADKFALCADGLRVVTLKQFPAKNKHLVLRDTYTLAMTWSKTTPVYVYVLDRSPAPAANVEFVAEANMDDGVNVVEVGEANAE